MAWIESHQSLATHRKLFKLCEELKIDRPTGIGLLHLLWYWALDNAPDGDLSGVPDTVLAEVSGFLEGRSHRFGTRFISVCSQFGSALRSAGFIDLDGKLHDWDDYAGKLIERRKLDATRKRVQRTSDGRRTDGVRTVPNPTVPNPTVPKNTKDDGVVLPDFIDKGLWNDFLDMRKKLRKPPTDKAKTYLLKDLENYKNGGDDPNEVIRQSIKNSWQGLFPLKAERARAGPPKPSAVKKEDEGPIEGLRIVR
ncbi:MAG: hypothetical protein PHU08_00065 [Dehalococcoidales bacterium]|nr:hypothetical protein [Dehalococcoidales bacterium]